MRGLPEQQKLRHTLAVPAQQPGHAGPPPVPQLRHAVVDRHPRAQYPSLQGGL